MKRESFQGILLGIVIMCAVFAFITIAWAAFSTNLTISGSATIKEQSWKIDFTNDITKDFATAGGGSSIPLTGVPTENADITNATFEITDAHTVGGVLGELNSGGDKITYTWYVRNFGTFDADITVKSTSKGGLQSTDLTTGGANIAVTCTSNSGATNEDDWCNGTTSPAASAHVKATLTVDSYQNASPAKFYDGTTKNIIADDGNTSDADILEFKLTVEFINVGAGSNPDVVNRDIAVSIPSMILVADQA